MPRLSVPASRGSVSGARRTVVRSLQAAGLAPMTTDDAELVLGELLGNAVHHGSAGTGGTVEVTWEVGRTSLRLAVADAGSGAGVPVVQAAGESAEGGRGLAIVDALSARWGVEQGPWGLRVWAELSRPGTAG